MQLDEKQENAVMAAVRNGIMILTGGPGTGKTTTINAMIEYFHGENMEIMLAAPTGRAAKNDRGNRMGSADDPPASGGER